MKMAADRANAFEHSIVVAAPAERVMAAFFDADALAAWWKTVRSVTTPRSLGVYAVEWAPTADADDIFGRLGGVFHGTVIEYVPASELLVADAWWLPPDSDPIGPMSLHVTCHLEGDACHLRVRQGGFEASERWRRYHQVIAHGWATSLAALKEYVEARNRG